METLNYKVLEGTGYNGYILKDAPVKVMQFGEGNFLRAFVDYFYDIANEKAGYNGKVKLVQPIGNFPQMADWINEQEPILLWQAISLSQNMAGQWFLMTVKRTFMRTSTKICAS